MELSGLWPEFPKPVRANRCSEHQLVIVLISLLGSLISRTVLYDNIMLSLTSIGLENNHRYMKETAHFHFRRCSGPMRYLLWFYMTFVRCLSNRRLDLVF